MTADLVDRPVEFDAQVREIEHLRRIIMQRNDEVDALEDEKKKLLEALQACYPLVATYPGDNAGALTLVKPLLEKLT